MSEDNLDTTGKISLDTKEALAEILGLKNAILEMAESKNLEGLIGSLLEMAPILGAIGVAAYATAKIIESTFDAERINAINRQFETLTKSIGISGDALKEGLEKAASGTMAETDLLQAANKAIIDMGSSAAKLPQVLEVARKSASVMGTDVQTAFGNITRAIEFGNQRMLKHAGIVLDVNQAFKAYADTLGIGVETLSAAGKQQALLNAVLEYGEKNMKGIESSVGAATLSWQRFKVASAEAWESFQKSVASSTLVSNVLNKLTSLIKDPGQIVRNHLATSTVSDDQEMAEKNRLIKQKESSGEDESPADQPGGSKASAQDLEKKRAADAKYAEEKSKINRALADDAAKNARSEAQVIASVAQQKTAIEEQYAARIQALDRDGLLSDQQKSNLRKQIKEEEVQHLKSLEKDLTDTILAANRLAAAEEKNAAKAFADGWKNAGQEATNSLKKFDQLGELAVKSFSSNASNAFMALGEGTKDAGEAMKGFMFGALGDIAEAEGHLLMAEGIGGLNPGAFAAGAALMVLAGVLRSQSSSSSTSISGGGDTSGSTASSVSPQNPALATSLQQNQGPTKTVTVQIMGDYLSTSETQRHLAEIIRNYQDVSDFRFLQIGTP